VLEQSEQFLVGSNCEFIGRNWLSKYFLVDMDMKADKEGVK